MALLPSRLKLCMEDFSFSYRNIRYQVKGGATSSSRDQLKEGYISPRLQELCAYYSNRVSYEEVAKLVERVSGERLLSDQKIWQIVSAFISYT